MMAPIGDGIVPPVILIIFNRPHHTKRVFDSIAAQRPTRLVVVADGPREDHAEDERSVLQARQQTEEVTWPCEVTRIYSEVNLGCRARILSGLDQALQEVPEAIILEDDCLPHEDFFRYASVLLTRYRSEPRVFSVGGHIWEFPDRRDGDGYYFSKYFSSWGWATWADRWGRLDRNLAAWPESTRSGVVRRFADSPMESLFWESTFDRMVNGDPLLAQAWDYDVQFTMWQEDMLSIRPFVNLVQNIGFGDGATHTNQNVAAVSSRQGTSHDWPLRHPRALERSVEQDRIVNEVRVGGALRRMLRDRW